MQVSLAEVGNDLRTCIFLRTGNKLSCDEHTNINAFHWFSYSYRYSFAKYSEAYMFIASCFS